MPQRSAGLLLFRHGRDGHEVLLAHPGGPFWARKDEGAWSIPKGEIVDGEQALEAALREFAEEMGTPAPDGVTLPLGEAVQPSRKVVLAFAREGDFDASAIRSNLIEIAWPPRSGRTLQVPEVDRAGWFGPADARTKLLPGQRVFLDRLAARLVGG